MSFRPDPKGSRTIEQAIADLEEVAEQLSPIDRHRARKISEMIRDLREYEMSRRVSKTRPPTK